MNNWINVTQDLPPKHDWVLVWDGYLINMATINSGEWWGYDMKITNVSHWMGLPTPPKEG
jgi:hypothetical protein